MNIRDNKSALDCIHYEVWMLNETYNRYGLIQNTNQIVEKNILIESFLIHVRNLVWFLEDRKQENYIRCSDFKINSTVITLPSNNGLNEINKFVGHLTWDRVTKDKPIWELGTIKEKVSTALQNFIEQLPPELFPTTNYKRNKQDFFFS